jgi:hypothetical protein
MTTTHTVTLPTLIEVKEYHEFISIEDTLRHVMGVEVTVEGFCFSDGWYVGVIYADGHRPTEEEIQEIGVVRATDDT